MLMNSGSGFSCYRRLSNRHLLRHLLPNKQTDSLTLHFNGHFPGEPGLAGVY